MEGLKLRMIGLGGLLVAAGVVFNINGLIPATKRSEAWVEQNSPTKVGNYHMSSTLPGTTVSYKMDKSTYDTLEPYGIVCRVFSDGAHTYDTVLIASNSKESFHDPRQCFSSQGNDLKNEREVSIDTAKHGTVGATFVDIQGKGGTQSAAYLYKGPDGFSSTNRGIKLGMFISQLKNGKAPEGVFYRFIASDSDEATFKTFIGKYLDASAETSHGFF